ncbi:cysteine--tRNA ligase [Marinivivus vitaminiproducens]|uniref:cysteine--tRNA ligase n=1 Tax=Marinivivus vitaminiproducens TaxID=3035935 RepID=UPI0027A97A02|nr:cysteine--tRNA ligase [Geminicoccaceae bacterium SCSIO 64248]
MTLALYNTMAREKQAFTPGRADHVGMYVCGPTVYDRIHIGNARPLIVFDVLYRLLKRLYPRVVYVRNITDIDDKIIDRAREAGEGIDALTARTIESFIADTKALGVLAPDVEPRATAHVAEMVRMIETLIERGHAYEAEGHVLFNVPSMPDYGALSRRDRDEQIAGSRVEVAAYKKDPADFVLWKPSTDEQPGWDSPWGRGRPGWHIECSAMAERYLGIPFDIHGGGLDLVFPHHENEIAQSRCAHDAPDMARVWMHNGFVSVGGEKMAKSLGNFVTVEDALKTAPGEAIRLWTLGTYYRQPLDYTEEGLRGAKATLDRFYSALEKLSDVEPTGRDTLPDEVREGLSDDLNTARAIAALHGLAGQAFKATDAAERAEIKGKILAAGDVLGLLQQTPEAWFRGAVGQEDGLDDAAIEAKLDERIQARKAKDFARADAIRDELTAAGIVLMDNPGGTEWRRK